MPPKKQQQRSPKRRQRAAREVPREGRGTEEGEHVREPEVEDEEFLRPWSPGRGGFDVALRPHSSPSSPDSYVEVPSRNSNRSLLTSLSFHPQPAVSEALRREGLSSREFVLNLPAHPLEKGSLRPPCPLSEGVAEVEPAAEEDVVDELENTFRVRHSGC